MLLQLDFNEERSVPISVLYFYLISYPPPPRSNSVIKKTGHACYTKIHCILLQFMKNTLFCLIFYHYSELSCFVFKFKKNFKIFAQL